MKKIIYLFIILTPTLFISCKKDKVSAMVNLGEGTYYCDVTSQGYNDGGNFSSNYDRVIKLDTLNDSIFVTLSYSIEPHGFPISSFPNGTGSHTNSYQVYDYSTAITLEMDNDFQNLVYKEEYGSSISHSVKVYNGSSASLALTQPTDQQQLMQQAGNYQLTGSELNTSIGLNNTINGVVQVLYFQNPSSPGILIDTNLRSFPECFSYLSSDSYYNNSGHQTHLVRDIRWENDHLDYYHFYRDYDQNMFTTDTIIYSYVGDKQ